MKLAAKTNGSSLRKHTYYDIVQQNYNIHIENKLLKAKKLRVKTSKLSFSYDRLSLNLSKIQLPTDRYVIQ